MPNRRLAAPRYRRRILGIGLVVAGAAYSIGAPIFNNRIEDDLERRVPTALAAAGYIGVTARFDGQDGTLTCEQPLSDPSSATELAYDVWGVHKITLDRACKVNKAPLVEGEPSATDEASATQAPTATAIDAEVFATLADAIAADPELSYLVSLLRTAGSSDQLADPEAEPMTILAPTDAAFEALPADFLAQLNGDPDLLSRVLGHHVTTGAVRSADLTGESITMLDGSSLPVVLGSQASGRVVTIGDATVTTADVVTGNGVLHVIDRVLLPAGVELGTTVPPVAAPVAAVLDSGTVTLIGVVAGEAERATLVNAAAFGVDRATVTDSLTIDAAQGLDLTTAESLGRLIVAMRANLLSGEAGYRDGALYVDGVFLGEAERAAMQAAADAETANAALEPRPEATDAQASALEADLNAFVAANPVRFEVGSAVLTGEAETVIDQLTARAIEFAGVQITVEGHTDSDGDPDRNLTLSQQRAEAVRAALIERGLEAGSITAEGFGSQQPVLVNGVEDKDASRRVEFRIVTTG
jgi:OOP family OmpA-OmpF porin